MKYILGMLFLGGAVSQIPSAVPSFNIDGIAQYGILGIVLGWFMFRVEKRLDRQTEVFNDLAKSIIIETLSRENITEEVRRQAQAVLDRTNARARTSTSVSVSA